MEEGENYRVGVWSIFNFSCWSNRIHDKVIKSERSYLTPSLTVELYPKGLYGNGECLVVHLVSVYSRLFHGEVAFCAPDGSLIHKQRVNSKEEKEVLELPPKLKFNDVVAHIKRKEAVYGDSLIVRYQIRSPCATIENMHTVIHTLRLSFRLRSEVFKDIQSLNEVFLFRFPLHDADIKPITLKALRHPINYSNIMFTLRSPSSTTLVFTRVMIESNDGIVTAKEDQHLFRGSNPWIFFDSLSMQQARSNGFSMTLSFKITSSKNYEHHLGIHQYHPFKIDILSPHTIPIPSKIRTTKTPFFTFPLYEPKSLVAALKNELMSLEQYQDFSDLTLKCNNVSIPVHKNILSTQSRVFKRMLSSKKVMSTITGDPQSTCDMQEAAPIEVVITDLNPSTLARFLIFLYTGNVEDLEVNSAFNLYYAADKYQVKSLKKECADFLCDNISISNVCDILSLSYKHLDEQLTKMAKDFFLDNFSEVLASEEWQKLMKKEPLFALEIVTDVGKKINDGKIGAV